MPQDMIILLAMLELVWIFKNENFKENQFDWRTRPLSKDKIDYAINDVKYLIPLYKK